MIRRIVAVARELGPHKVFVLAATAAVFVLCAVLVAAALLGGGQ